MRVLGVVLFLLGGGGAAYSTWAIYNSSRPRDVAFAVVAPLAVVVSLVGLLLTFVPGFFG